ncbi:hypothetical protein [Pseudooceanicola nanhaiensis]|uniref:hypothetical protein n=1 Tax=Pseudooceanicola nanhaiensis TaxID=375761 RepID=UPI0035172F91
MTFEDLIQAHGLEGEIAAGMRALSEEADISSLEELVDRLMFGTMDDFWEGFGDFRCCSYGSTDPADFAVYRIDQVVGGVEVGLWFPFDSTGGLTGPARLTMTYLPKQIEIQRIDLLEVMTENLFSDVTDEVSYFLENRRPRSQCSVPHRAPNGCLCYMRMVEPV